MDRKQPVLDRIRRPLFFVTFLQNNFWTRDGCPTCGKLMSFEKRRRITYKTENIFAHNPSTIILTTTALYLRSSWKKHNGMMILKRFMKRSKIYRKFSIVENKMVGPHVYICISLKKIRGKPIQEHGFILKGFLSQLKFTPL